MNDVSSKLIIGTIVGVTILVAFISSLYNYLLFEPPGGKRITGTINSVIIDTTTGGIVYDCVVYYYLNEQYQEVKDSFVGDFPDGLQVGDSLSVYYNIKNPSRVTIIDTHQRRLHLFACSLGLILLVLYFVSLFKERRKANN